MTRSLVHPRLLDRLVLSGFYPSRATVEGSTDTRSPSGAVISGWGVLPGLANIPAAVSPMIFTRAGERETSSLTSSETTHRIALEGSFPQITAAMRLRVTGPNAGVYDIVRPDRDSHGVTTVLEASIGSPAAVAGA